MAGILPTIIDVSSWQGDINWATVKPNIHFAILRVQDGTYYDKKLARNVSNCISLGIPFYVYGFYRNGGAVEAARMVSRVKAAGGSNAVRGYILDVEVSGQSVASINSAMATLNQTGKDNGFYIANHLYDQYKNVQGGKFIWIPTYGPNDGYAHTKPGHYCDLWQFTSQGQVPGISGGVDCNAISGNRSLESFTSGSVASKPVVDDSVLDQNAAAYVLVGKVFSGEAGNGDQRKKKLAGRYDEIQALVNHVCTANTSELASEVLAGKYGNGDDRVRALGPRYQEVQAKINSDAGVNTKKSDETVASEVIAGKWGNGNDRVNKLKAAGYDPDAIQSIVNKKLGAGSSSSKVYVVKSGDSLSSIAKKLGWGSNYMGLAKKNGISNPNKIYPGQKIYY